MPVKHRTPDAGILDHERKRKIEVLCLELQDELEEKGVAEDDVEKQVEELRQRLTGQGNPTMNAQPGRGSIKEFQRHELLAAKAIDNARFERALGIRNNYVEGDSINKEKQGELRAQRQMEKEQRNEELAERKRIWEIEQEQRKVDSEARALKDRTERAEQMERQRLEVERRAHEREVKMKAIQHERERKMNSDREFPPRSRNENVDSYRPARDGPISARRSRSPQSRRRRRGDSSSLSRSRSRSRSRSQSGSLSPPPPSRRGRKDSRELDTRPVDNSTRGRRSSSSRSRTRSRTRSVSRNPSLPKGRSAQVQERGRRRSYSSGSDRGRHLSRHRSRSRTPRISRSRSRSRSLPVKSRRISLSRSRSRSRLDSYSPVRDGTGINQKRSPKPIEKEASMSVRKEREPSSDGSEDMDVESGPGSP